MHWGPREGMQDQFNSEMLVLEVDDKHYHFSITSYHTDNEKTEGVRWDNQRIIFTVCKQPLRQGVCKRQV